MHSHEARKKAMERFALKSFLTHSGIAASIDPMDVEQPDFLIHMGGRRVGVELTRIHVSKERQAHFANSLHVLRVAATHYAEDKDSEVRRTTVTFRERIDWSSVRRDALGRALAEYVLSHAGHGTFRTGVTNDLPSEIGSSVVSVVSYTMATSPSEWWPSISYWAPALTRAVVQSAIDDKERLLPTYQAKGYDEYWLLIHTEPANPAQQFSAKDATQRAGIRSAFDRTYFYSGWECVQLA